MSIPGHERPTVVLGAVSAGLLVLWVVYPGATARSRFKSRLPASRQRFLRSQLVPGGLTDLPTNL